MYTPDNHELEKGIQITYDTLVEEVKRQKQKAIDRKATLQADANLLIKEVIKSLYLPDKNHVDSEGRKYPYVETYVKNAQGLYEDRTVYGLQTDQHHALNFYVGILIVQSGEALSWRFIPVEMFYKSEGLIVVSGEERSHVRVLHGEDQGRFFEAATMIKNSALKEIKDPNLD